MIAVLRVNMLVPVIMSMLVSMTVSMVVSMITMFSMNMFMFSIFN
jgi:hypothetical protein